jgi:hypothetical protein
MYYPKLKRDSLFVVIQDYVERKINEEINKQAVALKEAGHSPTANQTRELANRDDAVNELRDMLDHLKRIAPLWKPEPSDGVLLNYSMLWTLVPHLKSWQKELKLIWGGLCDGEYDWSRTAMRLWPERVVLKCSSDRSLAIAHGLEDVLWVESEDGKWTPRETPTRPMETLFADRSSEAVKAALRNLLEAPGPAAPIKRGRKYKVA